MGTGTHGSLDKTFSGVGAHGVLRDHFQTSAQELMKMLMVYLTLLFIVLVGSLTYWINTHKDHRSRNIIISFALFASTGVLLAMGSIEMAGRYGYSMIVAMFAFSLVFFVSPLILFPIRRLSGVIRLATSMDFLTFRFRGQKVAIASCMAFLLAVLALVLAQFLAVNSVASHAFGIDNSWLAPLALCIAVIAFILQSVRVGVITQIQWVLSAAGILLFATLVSSAWVSVEAAFGNVSQMDSWVVATGQQSTIKRLDSAYSLFIIFLAAALCFPINFNVLVSEAISDRESYMVSWVYPLLVLLACVPVFPILWSGLALKTESALQQYLFSVPLALDQPVIVSMGAASIILLAVAVCSSLIMISTRMILNSMVLPDRNLSEYPSLTRWINRRYVLISFILLCLIATLSLHAKSRSITDFYLVGFAGLAQLMPGMISAIYLPKVGRSGFLAGLAAGISIWFITLAIPLVAGDWSWQIPIIGKPLLFGMQAWEVWAIEALLVNITLCALFSLFSQMDADEQKFSSICMADNVYIPIRTDIAQKNVGEITESLRSVIGDEADIEIKNALNSLGFDQNESRRSALRQLRDKINSSLNLRFGVLSAHRIMTSALPLPANSGSEREDMYLLESVIAIHGDQLTGIASELNKLRVHHREILDQLPIGIVSLDKNGEILKWNASTALYTGISENVALGSYLADLPSPWCETINEFIASDSSDRDNIRIEIDDNPRWFNFQKSSQYLDDDSGQNIILLIEENTEATILKQKSIDNERLASIGRLAAGVAHEIGNPVTGIACVAQNLEHESTPQQVTDSAKQILLQTERINRIVESLIKFSRGGKVPSLKRHRVNLLQASEEAIQLLTLGGNTEDIVFQCNIPAHFDIAGDYHQLIQVLLNLLSNSRDASPVGSKVALLAEESGEKIILSVNDAGSGIQDDIQSSLFEPFVTSKDVGQGTGLGLWVVFNLIKALGAEIQIFSPAENSHCGTTVRLTFDKFARESLETIP